VTFTVLRQLGKPNKYRNHSGGKHGDKSNGIMTVSIQRGLYGSKYRILKKTLMHKKPKA
jgi:hypothetical protein